jgi:predicted RNA-binding Zn ribbon-like protein
MNETVVQSERRFDFGGGHRSLDFANTLEDRPREMPRELLHRYDDLVAWGEQAGIVTDEEARQLLEKAGKQQEEAATIFERAITLREAVFHILESVVMEEPPEESDMATLNEMLTRAMAHARLIVEGDNFGWDWPAKGEHLECVLWEVAVLTAELLTSDLRRATRICAAEDCSWLFLDTSKNHSRRWCDMKTCGNRAKARRYQERKN